MKNKRWKPQIFEATEVNINPFKSGQQAPKEFYQMYNSFEEWTSLPYFLDVDDWRAYAVNCYDIPDQETAERLFQQWQTFIKETSENE